MRVLLLDNYDSFTYNLAHVLREMEEVELQVIPHDQLTLADAGAFDKIIISPGPGLPDDFAIINEVIQQYFITIPILGVCLGMQAIYESFGGTLINLPVVHHGVSSKVRILDPNDNVFYQVESPLTAGRYHSWICDPLTLPTALQITVTDSAGHPMACRHQSFPLHGIQFHPESILTPHGPQMIRNFILRCN